jgi:acetolactate synthase regulatory subunit
MEEQKVYELQARLSGSSNAATLLRLLTVLHSRTDDVLELSFDGNHPAGPLVTGNVALGRAAPESLQSWLERLVDVVEARVTERRLAEVR